MRGGKADSVTTPARIPDWRALLTVILCLSMAGCESPPIQTDKTNNQNFVVEFLFEHDGCRIYRFQDDGRNIYYAHCNQYVQSFWQQGDGKASHPVSVSTSEAQP
jgi:hypothetical protein